MQFTASSADLLDALRTVQGAVPSKSTLPILECILFERDGDVLQLTATDLEISLVQRVKVQYESEEGEGAGFPVAVPAKRLVDTLRALPDVPVSFSCDEEFNVSLDTDQGHYKMVGEDGEDYPDLPTFEDEHQITIEGPLLQRAIDKTSFAVSNDALRPAMMGIYFELGEEQSRAVATDGHRLVKLTHEGITSSEPLDLIVPEKAVSLASRVAGEADSTITIGEGYARFDFGSTQVFARMIDETYPNYEAVIPDENEKEMVVNAESMLAAVKRVALYSSNMTHQVRLEVRPGEVEVSAEDIERSSRANEVVLCDYDDEELEIGFNSNYLQEVLGNVDSEEAIFRFSSPNRAGVVTPSEQQEGEEILMLIMPVMLNSYA